MTHEEYVIAAEHWDKKDATSKKVAKERLRKRLKNTSRPITPALSLQALATISVARP